jgi:hypothetical protein
MSETKEPEQILREMHELVDAYAKAKQANVVRPVPVVRDRKGKLTAEYPLKEWLQKINEEVDEFKREAWGICDPDEIPSDYVPPDASGKKFLAEEACDVITVIYGLCAKFGIDGDYMDKMMRNVIKKNRKRGYLDE